MAETKTSTGAEARRPAKSDARAAAAAKRGPGRPGGGESRSRILDAAGKMFARDGFDGVTIRRIASRAGVNLAAVGYHFGSKKGLYHEVMCQILADVRPILKPAVAALQRGVAAAAGDRPALAVLAAGFVRHTLTSVLLNDRLRWQHTLLLREFSQPSEEFSMILTEAVDPMHDAVAELVAAATGHAPGAPATRLLTTDIVGQCMVYQIARTLVCAHMGWDDYTPDGIEALIAMVTRAVQRTLGLPETPSAPEAAFGTGAAS